jgi:hypothetical protein
MTRLDHLRLMQHHDAELIPEDAELFESELSAAGLEAEAESLQAGLAQVGDFVRAIARLDAAAHAASADGIADEVLRRLSAGALPAESGTGSASTALARRGSLRWGWAAGAGGVLALAAGVLLFTWSGDHSPTPTVVGLESAAPGPIASLPSMAVTSAGPRLSSRGEPDPGVAIEMVDFGARSGTIFMVNSGEETPTPVVWLVDEAPDSGGRVEQL